MTNSETFLARLNRVAKTLRIESLSVFGFRIKVDTKSFGTDSFSRLLIKVGAKQNTEQDVLTITAHNVDEIVKVDRIDPEHECEAFADPMLSPGGSGANTSYTLGRLGVKVKVMGIVGADSGGRFLLDSLSEANVDISSIIIDDEYPTGRTVALVENGGKRFIVVHPGANRHLADKSNPDEIRAAALASRVVHLSSLVGEEEQRLQEDLVQALPDDTFVSITPGAIYSRQGLDRLAGIIKNVDAIFLYKEQLFELIRNSSANVYITGSETDIQKLLDTFFRWKQEHQVLRPQVVVVKDRIGHSTGYIEQRFLCAGVGNTSLERYISPCPLPTGVRVLAVDSTGTGDAAVAGFLYGMLCGETLEKCIDSAFLMAGFVSGEFGARTAFADRPSDESDGSVMELP